MERLEKPLVKFKEKGLLAVASGSRLLSLEQFLRFGFSS